MLPRTISAIVDAVNNVSPSIMARKKGVISKPEPSAMSHEPGASVTPSPSQSLMYSGHDRPFETAIPAATAKAATHIVNLFLSPDSESSICSEFMPSSSSLLVTDRA